ncbi:MAG: flippase [Candidatus Zixiibacteriota bacterium]
MSVRTTVLKNFFSLSFGQVAARGLNFLAIAYLARILGSEGFGIISFAQAILAYLMVFSTLGLDLFGTREIAANHKIKKSLFIGNLLSLRVGLALVCILGLGIFVLTINKSSLEKEVIFAYGLYLFPFVFYLGWVFCGIERMEYIGLAAILSRLAFLATVVILIKDPSNVIFVPYLWFTAAGVESLFLIFSYRKFGSIKLNVRLPEWKVFIKDSVWIGISIFLLQIYSNFDMVMLGFMKTNHEVGLYSAAYKLILFMVAIGSFYNNSVFPLISRYAKESKPKLKRLVSKNIAFIWMIGIGLWLVLFLFAPQLILLAYGDKYMGSVPAFQILSLTIVIGIIRLIYSSVLVAFNKIRQSLFGVGIGSLINVSLNFLLIPRYGIMGAAVATVIGEIIITVLIANIALKLLRTENDSPSMTQEA